MVSRSSQPPAAAAVGSESARQFAEQRLLLRSLAYRMLGSFAEAEDVVQDAWLRWDARTGTEVVHSRAYLVRVTTRLVLERLDRARVKREVYVGAWLPEPVITSADVADKVAESDTISMALMVVLETLSPLERLVFVLREAFGFQHAEIAAATGRTETAVRQLARRARQHVRDRHKRFDPGPAELRLVCDRFLGACEGGDIGALAAVLAPGVCLVADSGGRISAPRRPIYGAGKVARFLVSVIERQPASLRMSPAMINDRPGVIAFCGDAAVAAASFEILDGRVARIYAVFNPAKLTHLREPADVTFPPHHPV